MCKTLHDLNVLPLKPEQNFAAHSEIIKMYVSRMSELSSFCMLFACPHCCTIQTFNAFN